MMRQRVPNKRRAAVWTKLVAGATLGCFLVAGAGCFDPAYPQLDREMRVVEALAGQENLPPLPSPLSAADAVAYALCHSLESRVAELEFAYANEAAVAARRRLLPSLTARYSIEHDNHPDARWYKGARTGNQTLESSYSSDPNSRQAEIGLVWNLLDFGVGYLRARQQEERIRQSAEQHRRVRQQVVLDVLTQYWQTAAVIAVAEEAESLRQELEALADSIRDAVGKGNLSAAEGARQELAVHASVAELDHWRRAAAQAKLELAGWLGAGSTRELVLEPLSDQPPERLPMPDGDPGALQSAALMRRPELYQQDARERIAVDEARLALLQMAPNATLSLSAYDNPDAFLEWNNWMTAGARVSWNLFNIPARISEKRMAELQQQAAREKGLALAAAIMAQVGIAYSEWRLSHDHSIALTKRAAARRTLVEALAAGEADEQARPGEVLQERVWLLSERAAALRAIAETRVAEARLANAIGIDPDEHGRLVWQVGREEEVDLLNTSNDSLTRNRIQKNEVMVAASLPDSLAGLTVVLAEDFEAPADYFQPPPVDQPAGQPPAYTDSGEAPPAAALQEINVPSDSTPEDVLALAPTGSGDGLHYNNMSINATPMTKTAAGQDYLPEVNEAIYDRLAPPPATTRIDKVRADVFTQQSAVQPTTQERGHGRPVPALTASQLFMDHQVVAAGGMGGGSDKDSWWDFAAQPGEFSQREDWVPVDENQILSLYDTGLVSPSEMPKLDIPVFASDGWVNPAESLRPSPPDAEKNYALAPLQLIQPQDQTPPAKRDPDRFLRPPQD